MSVDTERTKIIEGEGYRVLRFWNNDVIGNAHGVYITISGDLHDHHPQLASPIKGEER